MTDTDWMPGAERVAGAHSGGTLVGGPPRCTWHITWDHLDPRPTFDGVRDYLVKMNYEPTLLWDPETGRVAEFISAAHSAYAVLNKAGGVETNRYGDVHVQIEVFFSPGYKGRALFTDGPLVGLEAIMAWLDALGVPRVAAGDWSNPDRDVNRWLTQPGHYGHFEVPENDHSDPIRGTDIALILATSTNDPPPLPPPSEDDMTPCFVEHPTRGPLVYVIGDDKAAWEYADGKAPRRLDSSFTSGLAARLLPDGGLALYGRGDDGALWRLLVTSDGVPAGLAPMGGHIFPP